MADFSVASKIVSSIRFQATESQCRDPILGTRTPVSLTPV